MQPDQQKSEKMVLRRTQISPFLDLPLRSREEAARDIENLRFRNNKSTGETPAVRGLNFKTQ